MLKGLKSQVFDGLMNNLFFNQPYLDPDDPKCNANEYFKEISYMINLEDIYKFKGTCFYHDQMPYCPIILEIVPEKVKTGYDGAQYLLQVWNMNKEKIYQKGLPCNVRVWSICYRYLVYTLEEGSEDSQYTYVVDLENSNHSIKVKNFGLDPLVKHIAYNNECLFAATNKEIELCRVSTDSFSEEGAEFDINDLKLRKIVPGLKIQGILINEYCVEQGFVIVALETHDNQIDFNRLFVDNPDDDDSYGFRYTQYREVVPRPKNAGDAEKNKNLDESRDFFQTERTQEDPIQKAIFVFQGGFNYSCVLRESGGVDLYWNMMKKDSLDDPNKRIKDINMTCNSFYFKMQNNSLCGFDHKGSGTLSFQQAEPISVDDLDWDLITMKKVQNIVHIYTGFKIFSIYTGANQQSFCVISHGKFISIFNITLWKWINHMEFKDEITFMFCHVNAEGDTHYSCMTKQGWVYVGFMYDGGNWQTVVEEHWRKAHAEGQLIKYCEDTENNQTLWVVHKNKENRHLSMLYKGELERKDKFLDYSEKVGVATVKMRGKESYLVIQNDQRVTLYKQHVKDEEFQVTQVKDFGEIEQIQGTIHSATAYDIGKHIFLFDEKNMYVIKTNPQEVQVYENIFCIGVQNFTKSYNYALCQDTPDAVCPGLRLFDMESIIKRNKPGMILLKKIDVGTLGSFEWSFNIIRIGMMKSFSHIAIVPILHNNMNKFMGMADTTDYITYKTIKDTMFAMTQNGLLCSWNITTAKLLSRRELANHDYSDYDVSIKYQNGAVLLKSQENIEGEQDTNYFEDFCFQPSVDGQVVFCKQGQHQYKRWKLLDIQNESTVNVALEFIHPSYDYQNVFFNKARDRMIEVLQNYRTFFYKRVQIPGQPEHMVKWQLIRRIIDYPTELEFDSQKLEFFSPCFSKYIVMDKETKQFVIKDTYLEKIIAKIPTELMKFDTPENALHVFNRSRFVDSNIMLITNEDGIEKFINIEKNFQEIQYNWRPLFTEIDGKEYEECQYYLARTDLDTTEVLKRLKRTYQQYKSSYFLYNKRSNTELNQDLITCDVHKYNYNHLSFTFLHWSLIEQIQSGKMSVDELESEVVQQILYNILPGGNTVLHKLADNETELIKLFKISHPSFEDPNPTYHVPFLPNLKGETPIHKCIEKMDYKSIDTILKYLKYYPTDHHSRGLRNIYGDLIEKELPEFLPYLDSRLQETSQTKMITKGCLRTDHIGIIPCDLWFKEEDFKNKLLRPKPIETRIRCEFLDLPGIYHYLDDEFGQVFESLSKTENMDYFELKSIQKLVDFNYPLVREFTVRRLFVPFSMFMLTFFIFMHFVYPYKEDESMRGTFYTFLILNLLFATYFLVNEVKQIWGDGLEYLLSLWNYIDLIPPIGIYLMTGIIAIEFSKVEISANFETTLLSTITFFMWFKFLYFLRIYEQTGYLIRMIIEVVFDMKYFFLLLLITIAAFGDSFLRLSVANAAEDQFTYDFLDSMVYTYRMILGDFDTSEFGVVATPVVWVLFLLCTIFNMIVMLNLLIAIISDSYARVTQVSKQATYQERCALIAENNYLIWNSRKVSYAEAGKYLLVVTNLEEEAKLEAEDPVIEKLTLFKEQMENQINIIKQSQADHSETQNKIQEQLKEHKENFATLKQLMLISLPPKKIKTTVHDDPLEMVLFEILKKREPAYETGWGCDGRNLCGCRGGKEYYNEDPEEYRYHCVECCFDYCEECFKFYGQKPHEHELQRLTHAEIMELHPGSYQSWGCDGRNNKSDCPRAGGEEAKDIDVIYHCWEHFFDLCDHCVEKYRAKE